jgi:signal transduction histidine kinase
MADRVRFNLDSDLPPVNVDFAQLVRALVNLMENALIYSPANSTVNVSALASGTQVLVSVEDSGPGVPDAEKSHVFEKFFRGEASASAPGGTGLGLAIASEVVRSHKGSLTVEDVAPNGARFVMSLPTAGAEQ